MNNNCTDLYLWRICAIICFAYCIGEFILLGYLIAQREELQNDFNKCKMSKEWVIK